jgi:hypothetical protein
MSSEKFLIKFFAQLSPNEFKKDRFLKGVYKFYKQERYIVMNDRDNSDKVVKKKRDNPPSLFECYTDYLIRNKEFEDDNEKRMELKRLYKDIVETILYKEIDSEVNTGFVTKEEKKRAMLRAARDVKTIKSIEEQMKKIEKKTIDNKILRDLRSKAEDDDDKISTKSIMYSGQNDNTVKKTKIVVDKEKALQVLSVFIQQSLIVTYEEPNREATEEDEKFKEKASDNIIDEISNGTTYIDINGEEVLEDARELPEAKPDPMFGQRSDMMNIWRDTESKCQELLQQDIWAELISKLFFIDTEDIAKKPDKIKTAYLEETRDILPVEKFTSLYTNNQYKTEIKLLNTYPVEETVRLSKNKVKCAYLCAGSQMVIGGNADQGIDCTESMLYLTSTYSAGLAKALHAYPLKLSQVLLCRNVLVFKNTSYKVKPITQWQRIVVINSPSRFRPALNIDDIRQDATDERLFSSKTHFKHEKDKLEFKKNLASAIEVCLFFGYDVIILDDRSIEDNQLPAHDVAKLTREVLTSFFGRVKEFIICISKSKSFNVFRYYY